MSINKRIKDRRLELGLTLKEVSHALGIAESTVSRYESSDIRNMGIDKIEALAKILCCSPGYLMGWEGLENSPRKYVADFTLDIITNLLEDSEYTINEQRHDRDYGCTLIIQKIGTLQQISLTNSDIRDFTESTKIYQKTYLHNKIEEKYKTKNYYIPPKNESELIERIFNTDITNISTAKDYLSTLDNDSWNKFKNLPEEQIIEIAKLVQSSRNNSGIDYLYPELNAARPVTNEEITHEMKKHDDDIMDDDNF